jgi:hypothetical protein
VNQQDQKAIEDLFRHLYQASEQAGPRDKDAEALIQRYVQQAPPGLLYQMAQRLVAQQATVNQLRSQLAAPGGAPAGFAPPPGRGYQGYGQPQYQGGYQQGGYQQGGWQQPGRPGGGFLAGAGQLALGIGGGIIGAEVLTSIFDGGLFGGDQEREYDDGFRDGFQAGDDDGYRDGFAAGDDQGQDPGGFDDPGSYDDGGGSDDGGGIF